jgi:hypothetical protein
MATPRAARDKCPYKSAKQPAVHDTLWEGWNAAAIAANHHRNGLPTDDFAAAVPLKRRTRYSATIWMRTASGDQGVKWRPVAAL